MPIDPNQQKNLDDTIFELLHHHSGSDFSELMKEDLEKLNISDTNFREAIENHYYLAPRNIKRAQILYGILVIIIALAISAVKMGTNFASVEFIGMIGVSLALPYFLLAILIRRIKTFRLFTVLARMSLVYSICLSVALVILALIIQLYGIILIPIILTILYLIEMHKLAKLKDKLLHE